MRQLEIRTRRMVNDTLAGEYHSVFKGRGMDFDEVREYSPGDEVRTIDWNVTARARPPFVKKFTEERELTILLLVDISASGNFGSAAHSKRELAAELASVLAFSAIRNSDKVGLMLFTDRVEHYMPPKKGRRHVLRVVRDILYHQPRGRGTDSVKALDFANHVLHRRAIVFLISDFQSPGDPERARADLRRAMRQTNRRHDLIAVQIEDPREKYSPTSACSPSKTRKPAKSSSSTPPIPPSASVSAPSERTRAPLGERFSLRRHRHPGTENRLPVHARPAALLQDPRAPALMKSVFIFNLRPGLALAADRSAGRRMVSRSPPRSPTSASRRHPLPPPAPLRHRRCCRLDAGDEDIRDIRGPKHIPLPLWPLWLAGGAALAGLLYAAGAGGAGAAPGAALLPYCSRSRCSGWRQPARSCIRTRANFRWRFPKSCASTSRSDSRSPPRIGPPRSFCTACSNRPTRARGHRALLADFFSNATWRSLPAGFSR